MKPRYYIRGPRESLAWCWICEVGTYQIENEILINTVLIKLSGDTKEEAMKKALAWIEARKEER